MHRRRLEGASRASCSLVNESLLFPALSYPTSMNPNELIHFDEPVRLPSAAIPGRSRQHAMMDRKATRSVLVPVPGWSSTLVVSESILSAFERIRLFSELHWLERIEMIL